MFITGTGNASCPVCVGSSATQDKKHTATWGQTSADAARVPGTTPNRTSTAMTEAIRPGPRIVIGTPGGRYCVRWGDLEIELTVNRLFDGVNTLLTTFRLLSR